MKSIYNSEYKSLYTWEKHSYTAVSKTPCVEFSQVGEGPKINNSIFQLTEAAGVGLAISGLALVSGTSQASVEVLLPKF